MLPSKAIAWIIRAIELKRIELRVWKYKHPSGVYGVPFASLTVTAGRFEPRIYL